MNENLINQLSNFDIAGTVFEEVLSTLPDGHEECSELLSQVRGKVDERLYLQIDAAMNAAIANALETGFRSGWLMRSKV